MDSDTKWGMGFAIIGIALALIGIGIQIVQPSYELYIGYLCVFVGVLMAIGTVIWLIFKK